jgi:hypothetical protein
MTAAQTREQPRRRRIDATRSLVYAVAAFVAGTGILIDAHTDDVTFLGELVLAIGGGLLIGCLVLWTARPAIFLPAMAVLLAVWTLRDVPADGISASEIARSAIVIAIYAALVVGLRILERRRSRPSA